MDPLESVRRVAHDLLTRTAEDLRMEAERSAGGIAFAGSRVPDGRFFMLAVCLVDPEKLPGLQKHFALEPASVTVRDWSTTTLAELIKLASDGRSMFMTARFDEYARLSALMFSAADPDSTVKLAGMFLL